VPPAPLRAPTQTAPPYAAPFAITLSRGRGFPNQLHQSSKCRSFPSKAEVPSTARGLLVAPPVPSAGGEFPSATGVSAAVPLDPGSLMILRRARDGLRHVSHSTASTVRTFLEVL